MATTTESKKMITLRFPDGEAFEIEESLAKEIQTIKHIIEEWQAMKLIIGDDRAESVIHLPFMDCKSMSKVIEYSKKHMQMFTLRSSDGKDFEIKDSVAKEFQKIKHMMDCPECVIPLPEVNSTVLSKVIEYSKKHVDSSSSKSDEKTADEELKAWDAEFLLKVDKEMIFDLMKASYYLGFESLERLAFYRWWRYDQGQDA